MALLKRLVCALFGQCPDALHAEIHRIDRQMAALERQIHVERRYWRPHELIDPRNER